jgi:glycosyltransferase involved in cell wall biosynthesis
MFSLGRAAFRVANLALGRIGNKLAIQAVRADRPRRVVVHDYAGHPFQVQLSRGLASRGAEILHLHCPSYPNGRGSLTRTAADAPTFRSEPIPLSAELKKYSLFRRPLQEIEYGRRLVRRIRSFSPDCVLSGNTPLLAQALVQRACRRHGISFVFWQQDIHGLAMQEIAREKLPVIGKALGACFPAFERRLLRHSEAVVVASNAFVDTLLTWGIRSEQLVVIENWAPLDELPLCNRDNSWRQEHSLGIQPVLLYSGTLGLKHDVEMLYQLARAVETIGARVVIVSEGLGADALRARLKREPCDALLILPFEPYKRLAEMMGAADILIAILGRRLGSYSVPSKVLTYHCAGRPILAAMPRTNPATQLILGARSGIVVEPEDTAGLVKAALGLLGEPSLRDEMGARARAYAEATFAIGPTADRFAEVLGLVEANPKRTRAIVGNDRIEVKGVR